MALLDLYTNGMFKDAFTLRLTGILDKEDPFYVARAYDGRLPRSFRIEPSTI